MMLDFGKYNGYDIGEVPAPYLCWLLRACPDMPAGLKEAVRLRLGLPAAAPTHGKIAANLKDAILRRWQRIAAVDCDKRLVEVGLGVLRKVLDECEAAK